MTMEHAPPRVKVDGFQCLRCLHIWVPQDIKQPPRVCPNCKSPYWQRPRKTTTEPRMYREE